jgi:hypothetical protein
LQKTDASLTSVTKLVRFRRHRPTISVRREAWPKKIKFVISRHLRLAGDVEDPGAPWAEKPCVSSLAEELLGKATSGFRTALESLSAAPEVVHRIIQMKIA